MELKLVLCCTSWCMPAYERCADGGVARWVAFGGANSREEAADVGSWAATQVAASHSIAFWLGVGLGVGFGFGFGLGLGLGLGLGFRVRVRVRVEVWVRVRVRVRVEVRVRVRARVTWKRVRAGMHGWWA